MKTIVLNPNSFLSKFLYFATLYRTPGPRDDVADTLSFVIRDTCGWFTRLTKSVFEIAFYLAIAFCLSFSFGVFGCISTLQFLETGSIRGAGLLASAGGFFIEGAFGVGFLAALILVAGAILICVAMVVVFCHMMWKKVAGSDWEKLPSELKVLKARFEKFCVPVSWKEPK